MGRVSETEDGRVSPEMEKLLPVSETLLTMSGVVPEEVTVNDFDVEVLRGTVPKLRLVVLTVISGADVVAA
jgi:hypothetical protein